MTYNVFGGTLNLGLLCSVVHVVVVADVVSILCGVAGAIVDGTSRDVHAHVRPTVRAERTHLHRAVRRPPSILPRYAVSYFLTWKKLPLIAVGPTALT